MFFPPGVGLRWHTNMTEQGLIKYKLCYSYGMPKRLVASGLRDQVIVTVILPMLGLTFRRTQIACPGPVDGWQDELPVPITQGRSKAELSSTWLVDRLLNGMAPAALVDVGGGGFEARMSFRGLPFEDVAATRAKSYVLPDVAVRIGVDASNDVVLRGIRLAYRQPDGTYAAPIAVTPADPEWLRFRAARAAACANFLAGQFDQHIARGHLVPEAVSVAMDLAGLDDDHPIRQILAPRVAEIPGVNLAADGGIWRPDGVLSLCSPVRRRAQTASSRRPRSSARRGYRGGLSTKSRPLIDRRGQVVADHAEGSAHAAHAVAAQRRAKLSDHVVAGHDGEGLARVRALGQLAQVLAGLLNADAACCCPHAPSLPKQGTSASNGLRLLLACRPTVAGQGPPVA